MLTVLWFYVITSTSQKRKTKEIVPCNKWDRGSSDNDTEKTEVLSNFFCLSFHWQLLFTHLRLPESQGMDWENEVLKVRLDTALSSEHYSHSYFSLYPSLLLSVVLHGTEHPFGLWSTVLAVSLSNFFATLSQMTGGDVRKRERFHVCQHCSAIARTQVWYQHWFRHKSKTQHWTGCCGKS